MSSSSNYYDAAYPIDFLEESIRLYDANLERCRPYEKERIKQLQTGIDEMMLALGFKLDQRSAKDDFDGLIEID